MAKDVAKDKAARLLRKRTSVSSATSSEAQFRQHRKQGTSIIYYSFVDPRGGVRSALPPLGPISFIFMQFSAKNLLNKNAFQ